MDDWIRIGNEYTTEWNFPNCLGAVDGKHIAIECHKNAGSSYFNYKYFHSMVLMACCDAKYCFTFVDIGSYVLDQYSRKQICFVISRIKMRTLYRNQVMWMVSVAIRTCWWNNGFWTHSLVNVSMDQKLFTVIDSVAIENTFGIYAARWRTFRRPIRANPETVDKIVKATVWLHNYLRIIYQLPQGFVDCEREIILGDWRYSQQMMISIAAT